MDSFTSRIQRLSLPRLPLEGHLDLTYRCNNACLHCWLWKAPNAAERADELTFAEIQRIVGEARALGTRRWSISGGEPMLREDFGDIFDLLTRKATGYSINSNGTLITPETAGLLKRPGTKMIALYGATAEVYDAVTRHPGGFEAALRGMRYLREAGASFIVQLIPMRANWGQWKEMQELAATLSPHQRVGAAWLYLSADGTQAQNRQIAGQRLPPRAVVELDAPQPAYGERMAEIQLELGAPPDEAGAESCGAAGDGDDRLFARCIESRRDFHIDPYGKMAWCSFIKDPALRYDLRRGSFREAWEEFIPSCADKVHGGEEWRENCGTCAKRSDCRWCGVYAYLETGRYSAPIPYLCAVADDARQYKQEWQARHRRYFQIAGITVRVESELNFDEIAFKPEFASFSVDGPGEDNVTLRHHFQLPDLQGQDLGVELYRKAPWAISRRKGSWIYRGISPLTEDADLHRVAVFSADHRHGTIYSLPRDEQNVRKDGWHSLSLFPTDQIWLAPLLADRQAVLMHSAAAAVHGQGLVFVGHSSAGKSTTMELLKKHLHPCPSPRKGEGAPAVQILCDDRNVIRKWEDGWRVHGTWSHGTTADVSSVSAPLHAILFVTQSPRNEIVPVTDRKEIWRRLLATLIRSAVTAEWWQKELDVLEQIVAEARFYTMYFDKTGAIVDHLVRLADET